MQKVVKFLIKNSSNNFLLTPLLYIHQVQYRHSEIYRGKKCLLTQKRDTYLCKFFFFNQNSILEMSYYFSQDNNT